MKLFVVVNDTSYQSCLSEMVEEIQTTTYYKIVLLNLVHPTEA